MKLRPMTLESLDVNHEATDASPLPVTSSAADPVGTSATVSGAMSVVLIGAAGHYRASVDRSEIAQSRAAASASDEHVDAVRTSHAANSNVTYVML